jgi:hypothetical protein
LSPKTPVQALKISLDRPAAFPDKSGPTKIASCRGFCRRGLVPESVGTSGDNLGLLRRLIGRLRGQVPSYHADKAAILPLHCHSEIEPADA